jgi:hypothetical protein
MTTAATGETQEWLKLKGVKEAEEKSNNLVLKDLVYALGWYNVRHICIDRRVRRFKKTQ